MASFRIYTYQFSPATGVPEASGDLFPDCALSAETVMKNKQKTFQALFDESSEFFFSAGEHIYRHQIVLNYNGIIVLRIANNKKIQQEENFRVRELVNQPSSIVIIDNRGDCQTIAIQHLPSSFGNTDQVARIMKVSFNEALKSAGLTVDIRRRIEENTFWNLVERCSGGVKSVKFDISYPNLPRVSDNVDELLIQACKEVGANLATSFPAAKGRSMRSS